MFFVSVSHCHNVLTSTLYYTWKQATCAWGCHNHGFFCAATPSCRPNGLHGVDVTWRVIKMCLMLFGGALVRRTLTQVRDSLANSSLCRRWVIKAPPEATYFFSMSNDVKDLAVSSWRLATRRMSFRTIYDVKIQTQLLTHGLVYTTRNLITFIFSGKCRIFKRWRSSYLAPGQT